MKPVRFRPPGYEHSHRALIVGLVLLIAGPLCLYLDAPCMFIPFALLAPWGLLLVVHALWPRTVRVYKHHIALPFSIVRGIEAIELERKRNGAVQIWARLQQGRRLVVHVRNYEFLPLMDVEDALTWAQTFADQLGVPMVDRTDAEALRAGVEKQIRSLETGIAAHREGNRSLYEVQAVEPPGVVWTHDGMCWRNIEMTRRAVRFGEMPPVKLSTIRAVFVDGRPRWGEAPGTARVHVATDVQTHVLYYAPVDPDEPSPELAYAMWFADRVREAAAAHEPASAEDVATALGVGRVPRDIMRAPEKLP